MQLNSGLGIYWSSMQHAQIGLDPRIARCFSNLNKQELRLVEALTRAHTPEEIALFSVEYDIKANRCVQIINSLQQAQLFEPQELADISPKLLNEYRANWRIHGSLPVTRTQVCVEIPYLNWIGTEIVLALAESGIGRLKLCDTKFTGQRSHPVLRENYIGLRKNRALASYLRANSPHIETVVSNYTATGIKRAENPTPHLAIVTGSNSIDPIEINDYLSRSIPALIVITEEIDITIGPLCLPDFGPCGMCLERYRSTAETNWAVISPQARTIQNLPTPLASSRLAAALALRAALEYIDALEIIPSQKVLPPKKVLTPTEAADTGANYDASTGVNKYRNKSSHPIETNTFKFNSAETTPYHLSKNSKSLQLSAHAWRIPPNPHLPELYKIPVHPECLCNLPIDSAKNNSVKTGKFGKFPKMKSGKNMQK